MTKQAPSERLKPIELNAQQLDKVVGGTANLSAHCVTGKHFGKATITIR
jgi:hypothetical protein